VFSIIVSALALPASSGRVGVRDQLRAGWLGLECEFWRRSNEERGGFVWVDWVLFFLNVRVCVCVCIYIYIINIHSTHTYIM